VRSVSQINEHQSSEVQQESSTVSQNKPVVSNQMVQEQQSSEQRADTFQDAAKDLGSMEGFNDATSSVGTLIDALVPRDGNTASLSVRFNIPVHPLVKITISLSGWAGRFGGNVILNSSIGLGARLEGNVKALWLDLKAYLAVTGTGYIKTMGDSGAEALEFMGLAVREIVAKHSEEIASYMMGETERSNIVSHMSDGEFAEVGVGLNVSAGASIEGGDDDDGFVQGANASAGYMSGIKFTDQNNDGQLEESTTAKASGSIGLNLNLGKFGLSDYSGGSSMGVNIFYNNDEVSKITTDLAFNASIQPQKFGWTFLAGCFSEVVMEMGKILRNGSEHFSGSAGVRLGKIADSISRLSVADNVASRLGNQMSEEMLDNSLAFKTKTQFSVKMTWNSDGSASLTFNASKVNSTGVDLGVVSVDATMGDTLFEHKIPFQS
jgi:hypothetical protein